MWQDIFKALKVMIGRLFDHQAFGTPEQIQIKLDPLYMLFERIQSCPIFNKDYYSRSEMFTVTSDNGELPFFNLFLKS